MDSYKLLIYALGITLLFCSKCTDNAIEKNSFFEKIEFNRIPKGLEIKNKKLDTDKKFCYKISLNYWDDYMGSDLDNSIFFNGFIFENGGYIYFIDSINKKESILFSLNDNNFSSLIYHTRQNIKNGEFVYYQDTTDIVLNRVFWSRMYDDNIYEFKLTKTDFYQKNDNISMFVSKKNGILGIYSSIIGSGEIGPSEIIYTYSGDIFPYIYDFDKTSILNKFYSN